MKRIYLLIVSIVCLLMVSCKKDVVPVPPEIKINDIVAQLTSVSIKGEYIFEGEIKNIYIIFGKDSLMVDTETRKMNIVEKNISVDIEGLTMDTRYYYQIQCVNKYSRYTCEIASFTTLGLRLATVTTNEVTDITTNSASCGGDVTFDGNSTVTSRGVCWSTKPNPTTSDKITVNGKGTGTFTSRLSNLTAETTYYVRAYAINEKGTAYGEERSFKTLAIALPTVTTNDVTDITISSASCGGNVTDGGGATVTERGICWSTNPNPTINDYYKTTGVEIGIGDFTLQLSNLTSQTTYYVRAYATNEKGTAYGEEKSFKTLEIGIPTVTTSEVVNIKVNSASCGGNVRSDGGKAVTARGICWSTKPNPTINDEKTTNGSGTGYFPSNLTNLTGNTTYYVRAYATNEKGTAYGEEKSFKTVEITLPMVTTNDIINIKANSATCGGYVTSDGNTTVTSRGVCWSTNPNPTINDNKTSDGSGIGSFTSNLINLTENTTYYVRAYATNEKGTSYGEVKSFTTKRIVEIELDAEGNEIITLNGVVFKMLKVEGGTFQMGAQSTNPDGANYDSDAYRDEKPVHSVTLSDYYIGETEVTQELWEAVMGSNPSDFKDSQKPVENVSWDDCKEFIEKLNNLTDKNFRLPTEAEWEYAARGGNKSQGYKYSGSNNVEDVAWHEDNSNNVTHHVKTKSPNELGIYDMTGNVEEWCEDWYGDYSSELQINPTGPSYSSYYSLRVIRGGSCFNASGYRVSSRGNTLPDDRGFCLGFRLALSQ